MTMENTGAHHQSNPACVISTPNARPSGTSPSPTVEQSARPLRISALVEGACGTPGSLASHDLASPPSEPFRARAGRRTLGA